jgi:2-polyprenyl-3-methyl-5-hydroxy-6-metoxy-1,4-benzoquinol methylase
MSSLSETLTLLHLLGDETRLRLLSLLENEELTVVEITHVLNLAQSRVSTHLGKLREAGLVRDRKVGVSAYYAQNTPLPDAARKLWGTLIHEVNDAVLINDKRRAEDIVAARMQDGGWLNAVAGQMERHYSPGRTWEATARGLLGLVRLGDVLDIGSGDGTIAEIVAPRSHSLTCFDRNPRMIDAAKKRLARQKNVQFSVGDMHQLPFEEGSFDHTLLFNVLTHADEPMRVLQQSARMLRPDGSLIVVTLEHHNHPEISGPYEHVNQGFEVATLRSMLIDCGLCVEHCEISSREQRAPYFQTIQAFAVKSSPTGLRRSHCGSSESATKAN